MTITISIIECSDAWYVLAGSPPEGKVMFRGTKEMCEVYMEKLDKIISLMGICSYDLWRNNKCV